MSRSGLFRAAALLAAGAAPLLAGSASAVEAPQLNGGLPDVGADKLITDATQHANPLEAGKALQLPAVKAPLAGDVEAPAAPAVPAAQERTAPAPLPELGTLPSLPNPDQLAGGTHLGGLKAPQVADLPVPAPAAGVISGTLPTING
ncbi:hypothetical protein ACIA8G_31015 [Lentzea sp. NPDC051213]|uniref:hypothetical protein n=1 Tax=Lentzea sp. NPDC051213 TaxID=3364126 RepID=UPI00379063E7